MKKEFDVMEACAASALDFIDTALSCAKNAEIDDDTINDFKAYLLDVHKMHYNTDIGEQGEHIEKYLDECGYYEEALKEG